MANPRLAADRKTFSGLVSIVAKQWKADGFARRGQSFNRRTDDGVVQAIGFQKFQPASPGVRAMQGGEDRLSGHFCVNYKLVVLAAEAAMYDRPAPDFVEANSFGWLHGRLAGFLGPDARNDLARPPEELARDVLAAYDAELVPLFDECATREGLVAHFDRRGALRERTGHLGEEIWGYCLASLGERERAVAVLQPLVDAALAEGRRRPDPYVDRIVGAARRGWDIELRA
jgi:hypothetical protein